MLQWLKEYMLQFVGLQSGQLVQVGRHHQPIKQIVLLDFIHHLVSQEQTKLRN
jgi:hypothetical protein